MPVQTSLMLKIQPHLLNIHDICVQAIQNSDCETEDIESADLIFVYDYCYYTWWLAHVHSLGRENRDTPGDYLIQASNDSYVKDKAPLIYQDRVFQKKNCQMRISRISEDAWLPTCSLCFQRILSCGLLLSMAKLSLTLVF